LAAAKQERLAEHDRWRSENPPTRGNYFLEHASSNVDQESDEQRDRRTKHDNHKGDGDDNQDEEYGVAQESLDHRSLGPDLEEELIPLSPYEEEHRAARFKACEG